MLRCISHKLSKWQWKLGCWWDGLTYRQRDFAVYLTLWYISMIF